MGRKPKAASSCAREQTRDERIDRIVRMMVSGQWLGGRSHAALADEWGCHPRTVADYAISAGAALDRMGTPLEEYVEQKLAQLDALHDAAMAREPQDTRGAIEAVKLQLAARGALVARHEVSVKPYDGLPAPELVTRTLAVIIEHHPELLCSTLRAAGYVVEPPTEAEVVRLEERNGQ